MKAVKCHSFWRDLAHGICIPISQVHSQSVVCRFREAVFTSLCSVSSLSSSFSSCCCLFDYCLPCFPSSPSEWHMSVIHAPGHWTHQEQLRSISKPNSTTQEAPSDLCRTHANALNHFLAVNIGLSQNIKTMLWSRVIKVQYLLSSLPSQLEPWIYIYIYILQLNRFVSTTHWPFKGFLLQPASRFAFLGRSWTTVQSKDLNTNLSQTGWSPALPFAMDCTYKTHQTERWQYSKIAGTESEDLPPALSPKFLVRVVLQHKVLVGSCRTWRMAASHTVRCYMKF